jgi:hypothetical protein
VNEVNNQYSLFLLEETFQLLRESLQHDPFSQSKYQPTKKHIIRFRELLGQEFTFWLAETGNLFYAVLISAKTHVDKGFGLQDKESNDAKIIYALLLHTSQLIMCTGLRSEQTIVTLLKLDRFTNSDTACLRDIHDVIDDTLCCLQTYLCKRAVRLM